MTLTAKDLEALVAKRYIHNRLESIDIEELNGDFWIWLNFENGESLGLPALDQPINLRTRTRMPQ